jgi:hypothetical protein
MKSLSMPEHLDVFAKDVAEMERFNPVVSDEEECDFFIPSIDDDDDDDDTEEPISPPSSIDYVELYSSNLSIFECAKGMDMSMDVNMNNSIHHSISNGSMRLSERGTPSVATVREEDGDDGGDESDNEQEKQKRHNAQAAIAALAGLLAFPEVQTQTPQCTHEKNNRIEASPTGVASCSLDGSSPCGAKNPQTKPKPTEYRSIFAQLVDQYAWRPEPEPEEEEKAFTHLTRDGRAHSLPVRGNLPRKGSLKRISSLYKSDEKSCDAKSDANSSSGSLKRNVSFSSLEIREYNIALSDHPSCSYGPPIQLGWDYRAKKPVEVEDYEENRKPRRATHEMVLSYNARRYLLLKRAGYSDEELKGAMMEVERVKRERMVTDLFLPASQLDETMENVLNSVKTTIFGASGGASG